MSRLRAWRLRRAPDLLAARDPSFVIDRSGSGVCGIGAARRVVIVPGPDPVGRASRAASDLLSGLSRPPGAPAPLVAGSLPFDGSSCGTLVLPRIGVRSTPDGSWAVALPGRADAAWPEMPSALADDRSPADYVAAVRRALERIDAGELEKVVLARTVTLQSRGAIDVSTVARRLREADPTSAAFLATVGPGRWLVGVTPELLVARHGRLVRTTPLAGSALRSPDRDEDAAAARALMCSEKDRREHVPVASAVVDALAPFCERLDADREPRLASTATMWHLATRVRGVLRDPPPTALELAAALHPTPAVCGVPTDAALATIRDLEGFERGGYTGIVGWMDADGDGEWTVALRCAEVEGRTARLFAGSGIVAGSDPGAELAETEAKLVAMRRGLTGLSEAVPRRS